MSDERDHPYPPAIRIPPQSKWVGIGLLAAPVAWLVHLIASFAVVEPACAADAPWLLHAALTIGALVLAITGGVFAFNALREAPDDEATHGTRTDRVTADGPPHPVRFHDPRSAPRNRLLAATAIVNSILFSTIIVLSWTATLVIPPCAP